MYLKFINGVGDVIRYYEVKKRIIIGKVRDFGHFSAKRITITVDRKIIDITEDIKLLHNILMIDFKGDFYQFESIYNNALIYVANTQQTSRNILILFGSVFLDLSTRQFFSIPIINGNVLLENAIPVECPNIYKT